MEDDTFSLDVVILLENGTFFFLFFSFIANDVTFHGFAMVRCGYKIRLP